ncbi:hypothetical protein B0H17DRAFT_1199062 [Mycena rosella]|uniref:Uncharacterized protein n=1 Tax=Mycena rosella TaxID=1033263 RepID=A0AAD7DN36_MYCRO|nr:hypothetical protein B0H17DRAFT_1199062 [Mycena rosella]
MAAVMCWTGRTEEEFIKFKVAAHIMVKATTLKLDAYAGPQAQDGAKWTELVADGAKEFPALRVTGQSSFTTRTSPHKASDSSAQRLGKRKAPPNAGKENVDEPTSTNIQQSSSQGRTSAQPPTWPENERISTHVKESGSQRSSGLQGAPSRSFTQSEEKPLAARRNGVSSTTRCEYVEITDFPDTHLDNTVTGPRPAKIQAPSIPRPSEGLVNVLGQHTCSYFHIKKHMRIADDSKYFDIVDCIEGEILSICRKPLKNRTPSRPKRFLNRCMRSSAVDEEIRGLLAYIRAYQPIPGRSASRPARNAPEHTNKLPRHECPRHMYPAADVLPSVSTLLAHYGMEGLPFCSSGFTRMSSSRLQLGCSAFQGMMMRYIIERV